jgi:hypothetical protein
MIKTATLKPTDRTDEFGAVIYRLAWEKKSIDCITGLPSYGPVPPSEDYPGSCRPIPQGNYLVGAPVKESLEDCDAAIGPDWIPLEPQTETGGRGGFLIHRDWNYRSSPGTAGCIAPIRHQDMDVIVAAVAGEEFAELVVDHGFTA